MAGPRSSSPVGDPDRRLAAVWFCDVVDSTKIAVELGDHPFRLVIERFLAVVRSAIRRNHGREIDIAGDGVFAIFDAPANALRAAFEATIGVRDLGLGVRSGVHVGEVEQDPDGRVGGIAVHVGARVASLAAAGEILTTATTGELASGGGSRFEERGKHALKGIAGMQTIVAVTEMDGEPLPSPIRADEAARRRMAASMTETTLHSAGGATTSVEPRGDLRPFVGRARELDEMSSALGESMSGHGSLFLISGEAGIGKSRLMEEVAEHAEDVGWHVLIGRCWEGGGAPAYWPWIQVVRAAGGEFDRLASDPHAVSLSGAGQPQRSPVDPEAARFRLFDEVTRFLAEAAGDRPSLIVLDDLHVADEPSLLLLRFLATGLHERPLVVLGSYRENEPTLREHAELFGELTRLGRRVPLRGLSPDEVARYIEIASGDIPSEAMASKVSDVTGGNPFFLGEVVRTLMAEGRLSSGGPEALRLPEEVRALIRRRVSVLSPQVVGTLRVASVVGRDFDLRVIEPASTLGRDRVVDVLGEAERAGVIVKDRDLPHGYAFAHDLVRATLYEDLPAARRMQLHRSVGSVLEELFADDLESHLAEIAHHFAQAAPLGEFDRALTYSIRAGDRAAAVLAYEDAARQYARALTLLVSYEGDSGRRGEILLRLGDARSRAGDSADARVSFEEAAGIGRREGDPELLAEAAIGYARVLEPVQLGLGGILITAQTALSTTSIALLEEALEAVPEGDGSLRARALARLATELYVIDPELRLEISERALDMALRLGDTTALLAALQGRHWATLSPEGVNDRLANAQQTLLVATGANDDEAAFLARHARLHCFLELCDAAGVDGELDAMTQIAGRSRQPFQVWHAASMRAMRTMLMGHAAEAEQEVRKAVGSLGHTEQVEYMVEYAQVLGIRWCQGRLGDIGRRVRDHGHQYPIIPRWRDALAAAEVGDVPAARMEIERHARDDFGLLPRDGLWILHLCSLAQACVLVGDGRRAAVLYELLSPYGGRMAISVSTIPFGPVAMRLGMLAGLLERWKEAEDQFALALERCRAMSARSFEARVLVEYASMLLARESRGDEKHAHELGSQALAMCEELDLSGVAERASRMLGKSPSAQASAPGERATFRREGQFWTIAYGSEMARLRDVKGLRYIHILLSTPGRDVHVLELAGLLAGDAPVGVVREEGLKASRLEAPDAVLDPAAKETYRRRMVDLAEDLDEARSWNDPERAARIEEEIDALATELERALGLRGRDRGLPSPAERARVSVTKAIRGAIRAISRECPGLGEHLDASLRTGRFCSYAPPGHEPPAWAL